MKKKECRTLDNLFGSIMIILRRTGRNEIADKIYRNKFSIGYKLRNLGSEKMSVNTALQTFRELHASINELLSNLPTDDSQINSLVQQIKVHQQTYYRALITEAMMHQNEKNLLSKLWRQEMDEERGSGQLKAA